MRQSRVRDDCEHSLLDFPRNTVRQTNVPHSLASRCSNFTVQSFLLDALGVPASMKDLVEVDE